MILKWPTVAGNIDCTMMPRTVLSVHRRCFDRLTFSCSTRSRRHPLMLPVRLPLQPAWHHSIRLCGRRYGRTRRVSFQRGILASSLAPVKIDVMSAPCEPQLEWRESTPEPSLLMIRTDTDPSLPPNIYGSVEFEAEAVVEASQR